nr:acyl-CoA dehydratase activase-related protein [Treponema vincentii]
MLSRQNFSRAYRSALKAGVTTIFYPCIPYETKEDPQANNHFNCPVVTSYRSP